MKSKFWNFVNKDDGVRELIFDGVIADEKWFGDEVTPKDFANELNAGDGDLVLRMQNSPGGDCFAAAVIYTMLKEYKGYVTVKIDGVAASAASVVAMAGDKVLMSEPALLMIHNPMTIASGDHNDMERAIKSLDEVKEAIINAYKTKSNLSRETISQLMEDETWMNVNAAMEYGFADGVIGEHTKTNNPENKILFSQRKSDLKLVALASEEEAEHKQTAEEAIEPKESEQIEELEPEKVEDSEDSEDEDVVDAAPYKKALEAVEKLI